MTIIHEAENHSMISPSLDHRSSHRETNIANPVEESTILAALPFECFAVGVESKVSVRSSGLSLQKLIPGSQTRNQAGRKSSMILRWTTSGDRGPPGHERGHPRTTLCAITTWPGEDESFALGPTGSFRTKSLGGDGGGQQTHIEHLSRSRPNRAPELVLEDALLALDRIIRNSIRSDQIPRIA